MRIRFLAATLTAFAAVSLAACSSSGSGSATSTAAAGSPTSAAAAATASGTAAPAATDATSPAASAPVSAPAPTDGSPGASAPAKPAPPTDAGLPAKPGSDVTAKLVAALDAIDPAIVGGKPEQAVDRARNQCQSMYQFPKDKAKLVDLANQRFTSPDHPQGFGPDKAAKINDALRATLCPPA
ncbi:hypothetical protein F7Q99_22925 [Streptomyces kaniharaensis]|uniref:DUF732 domain-containing protein n=1 Tax=Streptomyces kaniharaensis TaxID=212423 RepID=A0A6N7KXR0_9ACTN|nr:hypothetical protein [Streptomyces kaniharaensis]MQS15038.1 hypothetical protein [Streptomyces kaniharaensis]